MFKLLLFCGLAVFVLGAAIPENDADETDSYIVGGHKINITEVPYIASMQNQKGHHSCGGTILSPTTIVTAAHCCVNKSPSKVFFRVGSEWRMKDGHLVQAKSIHIHPKFSMQTMDFDVAVIELATPLKFSDKIKPIPLIETEPDAESDHVRASGWGHLQENGKGAEHLQSVLLAMVDRKVCAQNLKAYIPITNRMICAGQKGKDSCQGDSGGPLVSNDHLAGIVSFGIGCARDKLPGVYTNVAHKDVTKFIKKYTKDSL